MFVRWVQGVLQRYGGALLQLTMGDKGSYLYAAFGAPIAHEDDPARAVAAALELRSPPAELSFIMNIKIGVTYGQMRAGAYGGAMRRTYGVLGDKTNLAARLMQIATDILCDEAIYRATQVTVAFEVLSPIRIKGKAQPVAIYRPLSKTPQSVIGSRIDQLALTHQLTLKVASVIGQVFMVRLLRDIYPSEADKPLLEEHLQALTQLDLVARHPSESHMEGCYIFNDPVTQETSYGRLLFAQRRRLHRAVAEWYERTYADDLAPYYPLLAQHWGKAEDTAKAIQYLERAGEQAQRRGDYQEAIRYFNESLALNAQAAILSAAYSTADEKGV
jgi:tetratricopeptide (TPR) repeat protein